MDFVAESKNVRLGERKVRLVADAIRALLPDKALASLSLMQKRAAIAVGKTIESALANAVARGQKKDNLIIKRIEISQGSFLKRYRPSTRGRVHPYKKRSCHIKIVLGERKPNIKIPASPAGRRNSKQIQMTKTKNSK